MDLIYECAEAPTIMASVLNTLTINQERAKELCQKGFITATDLMEALAHNFSLPLRQAKMVIERAVKYSESHTTETVSFLARGKAGNISRVMNEYAFGRICGWFTRQALLMEALNQLFSGCF